jgi:hypothetical protein
VHGITETTSPLRAENEPDMSMTESSKTRKEEKSLLGKNSIPNKMLFEAKALISKS